eukprot:TRINITY_DN3290_c0_g1_i3.p1 TRINITY_DN3290_c0_g1~~TRINITY_DN3290_c0_g1_i3.p1  ORF type:complete len:253 (-),score=58.38 TRINITY_DN3290_c0_g1_i3:258-1016(-)
MNVDSCDDFKLSQSSTSTAAGSSAATNTSTQPDLPKLPFGHCLVNVRWRNHEIIPEIQKSFTSLMYTDDYDFIDFHPSSQHIVAVLSEAEVLCNNDENQNIRRKFARIYKLSHQNARAQPLHGVILFHFTEITEPFFQSVQSLCVLDFSMTFIPLNSYESLPPLLSTLKDSTKTKNPFKMDRASTAARCTNKDVLIVLMAIPGVGEKQARKLLEKFGSLRDIAAASQAELSSVVGDRLASGVADFLDRKNTV